MVKASEVFHMDMPKGKFHISKISFVNSFKDSPQDKTTINLNIPVTVAKLFFALEIESDEI